MYFGTGSIIMLYILPRCNLPTQPGLWLGTYIVTLIALKWPSLNHTQLLFLLLITVICFHCFLRMCYYQRCKQICWELRYISLWQLVSSCELAITFSHTTIGSWLTIISERKWIIITDESWRHSYSTVHRVQCILFRWYTAVTYCKLLASVALNSYTTRMSRYFIDQHL